MQKLEAMLQEDEEATFRKDEFAKESRKLFDAAFADGSFEQDSLDQIKENARQHVEEAAKKRKFKPMPDKDRIEELIGNMKTAQTMMRDAVVAAEAFLASKHSTNKKRQRTSKDKSDPKWEHRATIPDYDTGPCTVDRGDELIHTPKCLDSHIKYHYLQAKTLGVIELTYNEVPMALKNGLSRFLPAKHPDGLYKHVRVQKHCGVTHYLVNKKVDACSMRVAVCTDLEVAGLVLAAVNRDPEIYWKHGKEVKLAACKWLQQMMNDHSVCKKWLNSKC